MNKHITLTATLIALLSTSAMANEVRIDALPDKGEVSLHGTVDSVENEREFTLRDKTGKVDVNIASNQSVTLKEGDSVTVKGTVDKGITGTDIEATQVSVVKGLAQSVSDAMESVPGVSTMSADAYQIGELPKEGTVKITGIVTDVDNEKEFTLKDDTGSIDVDIQSGERAALTKGAEVTVIGNVDSGVLGKDIKATKVLVVASE